MLHFFPALHPVALTEDHILRCQLIFGLLELRSELRQLLLVGVLLRVLHLLQTDQTVVQVGDLVLTLLQLLLQEGHNLAFVRGHLVVLGAELAVADLQLVAFSLVSV